VAESSLDKVLRRSVDDNAWDEESDEVWRGMDRSRAEHFGHERLKVYQKGMPFASMRKTLLDDLPQRFAECSGNS
jgi:hypothetical protein